MSSILLVIRVSVNYCVRLDDSVNSPLLDTSDYYYACIIMALVYEYTLTLFPIFTAIMPHGMSSVIRRYTTIITIAAVSFSQTDTSKVITSILPTKISWTNPSSI